MHLGKPAGQELITCVAYVQVPAALQSAADAGQDVVKLRLQRAFLEQYSTEEHKVPGKGLLGWVVVQVWGGRKS